MKKYLVLYFGTEVPGPDAREAWARWFATVGDRMVDSGNPLGPCVELAGGSSRPVSWADGASMGYSILTAASLHDAARLLDGCPAAMVRVHEAVPM